MVDSHLFQNTFPVSTLPQTYIILSWLSSLYPLCSVKHHNYNYNFLGTTFWFTRWSYVQFFPSHGVTLGGKSSCLHSPQPFIRRCESKHHTWSFPCCQSTLDSFFFVPLAIWNRICPVSVWWRRDMIWSLIWKCWDQNCYWISSQGSIHAFLN